ncbi:hypothetical protein [Nocardioides sp. MH1]|uniref:hypothetical protein n=1 Tax=Nocardioides sp. MH1 TaxID=3242490 RepID=UPI0035218CD6
MANQIVAVWGVLLPESTLDQQWFRVLAAFVAVNMLVFVTISIARSITPPTPSRRARRHIRGETRSIHPDGPR